MEAERSGGGTVTLRWSVADAPQDITTTPSLLIVADDAGARIALPARVSSASGTAARKADWIVAGITGSWGRSGVVRRETPDRATPGTANPEARSLAGIFIAVPPMPPYLTAYGHGAGLPWPGEWSLLPLDHPGRATIERVEMVGYFLQDFSLLASARLEP